MPRSPGPRGGLRARLVEALAAWRFDGDVRALPDGTIVAPQTPLLEIDADRISATLVESLLLSIVGQQTLVASKAARIVHAAAGRPVWDLSLRRLHGPMASFGVARAAYGSGFAGTATVRAAHELGIPSTGTMAHHFVMAYGEAREQEAFEHFLLAQPDRATLLPDTFEPLRGCDRAIAASRSTGVPIRALRLDSGDLAALAHQYRRKLDEAQMSATMIGASNDLDEYKIAQLLERRAPIDWFGVGTMLSAQPDLPGSSIGVVYKISQQHDRLPRYCIKLAKGKTTDPGQHQVWRTEDGDVLGLIDEEVDGRPLMRTVMENGVRTGEADSLDIIRRRVADQQQELPAETLRLEDPVQLRLARTDLLLALRRELGAK